ncbi:hypothetical protein V8F33_010434, partial [Rhypophila sp. PSN 637]
LQNSPQEIRDIIYNNVFATTNFCFGKNPLALLRTCRLISRDIGKSWIRQVCFFFDGAVAVCLKLAHVHESLVSQIRYMCVREKQLPPFHRFHSGWTPFICDALAAIPALRLDLLFVLGNFNAINDDFHNLETLMNESEGWRELRYLSHAAFFMFGQIMSSYFHQEVPTPTIGQQIPVMRQDGPGSESSVVLYRDPTR